MSAPSTAWEIATGKAVRWEAYRDADTFERMYCVANWEQSHPLTGWTWDDPVFVGRGRTPDIAWGAFMAAMVRDRILREEV